MLSSVVDASSGDVRNYTYDAIGNLTDEELEINGNTIIGQLTKVLGKV